MSKQFQGVLPQEEGDYFVLANTRLIKPIFEESQGDVSEMRRQKRNQFRNFLNNLDNINPDQNEILVETVVGARVRLNSRQLDRVNANRNVVAIPVTFRMQGRPIMQGNRPIMQGEELPPMDRFYYDSANKTSFGITHLGGPVISGSKKRVWILDTGIDGTHPDLSANLIQNSNLHRSFTGNDPLVDRVGHGTHCAGIVAGETHQEGLGMNGMSPGAPLVSLQVLDENGEGSWLNVLFALEYAATHLQNDDVVLMSLGEYKVIDCSRSNPALNLAIRNLTTQRTKAFVVMSAGNCINENNQACNANEQADFNLPGCITGNSRVITVTALNFTENGMESCASDFALLNGNRNNLIDYIAPGRFVFSTFPGNKYIAWSGTSMSAAMVDGLISAIGERPGNGDWVSCPSDRKRYKIPSLRN